MEAQVSLRRWTEECCSPETTEMVAWKLLSARHSCASWIKYSRRDCRREIFSAERMLVKTKELRPLKWCDNLQMLGASCSRSGFPQARSANSRASTAM